MLRMAPEGWPFVIPLLVLTALSAALGLGVSASHPLLRGSMLWGAGVLALLAAFTVFFFRDPERRQPEGEGLVLAPADGRIVEIVELPEPDPFVGPATRISIFLSIFNVHVQRAPITGQVELKEYKPGSFAVAWAPKASEDNEQATLGIASGTHRIKVRQIAGLVARRIVTDPEEGATVSQGSRIGLIRFGSRVDLILPRDWALSCAVGDRARAGLTVLARTPTGGQEETGP